MKRTVGGPGRRGQSASAPASRTPLCRRPRRFRGRFLFRRRGCARGSGGSRFGSLQGSFLITTVGAAQFKFFAFPVTISANATADAEPQISERRGSGALVASNDSVNSENTHAHRGHSGWHVDCILVDQHSSGKAILAEAAPGEPGSVGIMDATASSSVLRHLS